MSTKNISGFFKRNHESEPGDTGELKNECTKVYNAQNIIEAGQIHSFNSGMEWRTRGESMRLNTEKGLSKMIYGDRIKAYRCEHCKKITISYE